MNRFGYILVHGYTGLPSDFSQLEKALRTDHGPDSVITVRLPKHGMDTAPPFEIDDYIESISGAVGHHVSSNKIPAFIGHSTGGIFILSFLAGRRVIPGLLILASVPKTIDASYLERWERHTAGTPSVTLTDVAKMVSRVNTSGSKKYDWPTPLMIIHGDRDELVPCDDAFLWRDDAFAGRGRILLVPLAGHHVFRGDGSSIAIAGVRQFIADACEDETAVAGEHHARLMYAEPKLSEFLRLSPSSARHILACPAGVELTDAAERADPVAGNMPVFANIEPTTYCNLNCRFCARSFLKNQNRHMAREMFRTIVSLLTHVFRITLVGLGEPLMNPHIVDLVADAAGMGKRVGIVTNSLLLDKRMSLELVAAGLDSITFSIDAHEQSLANELRSGTDFPTMIDNIRTFMECAESNPCITTSVFCALSVRNIEHLEKIIDLAAELKVRAVMASDINFEHNQFESLRGNNTPEYINMVRAAISHSIARGLPLISVRGLEQIGIEKKPYRFLLRPGEIFKRKKQRTNCCSPWQSIPINNRGDVALCDCQPDKIIGNLLHNPLDEIWNSDIMVEHRRRMTGSDPPSACLTCPRF